MQLPENSMIAIRATAARRQGHVGDEIRHGQQQCHPGEHDADLLRSGSDEDEHRRCGRGRFHDEAARHIGPGRPALTEDTTTRGVTMLDAVAVVREYGCEVVLVTLIVDRGDTAAGHCASAGVPYRPLLTAADLGFAPDS